MNESKNYLGNLGYSVPGWHLSVQQLFSNLLWKIKNCTLNLILVLSMSCYEHSMHKETQEENRHDLM